MEKYVYILIKWSNILGYTQPIFTPQLQTNHIFYFIEVFIWHWVCIFYYNYYNTFELNSTYLFQYFHHSIYTTHDKIYGRRFKGLSLYVFNLAVNKLITEKIKKNTLLFSYKVRNDKVLIIRIWLIPEILSLWYRPTWFTAQNVTKSLIHPKVYY